MTVPVWVWAASAAGLIAAVTAEIVLTRRGSFTARQATGWVVVYVSLAVLCGLGIWITAGWVTASQFYAGYLTEYSLSLDNLFVFAVIMTWFAVPPARQPRVLLFGIGLALVLRTALIVGGATALNHFDWLFYPLGAILLWTAAGLIFRPSTRPDDEPERHTRLAAWLRRRAGRAPGSKGSTPMLLLIAVIGVADLLFAFDSIPAVFGITTDAYIVVACNVFALMGLRQLYTLVAGLLGRIVYLNAGLGVICAFIGVRLLLRGAGAPAIPAGLSVVVIAAVLLATVLAGMIASRRAPDIAERTMLERRFAVIDTDGNGVWQRDDGRLLTQRLCEAFGHAPDSTAGRALASAQQALFDAMLAHLDANDDAQISRDEFVTGVGRDIADRPGFDAAVGSTARTLIQVADVDGNGVLDAAELTAAISQFFASRDPRARGNVAFGYL